MTVCSVAPLVLTFSTLKPGSRRASRRGVGESAAAAACRGACGRSARAAAAAPREAASASSSRLRTRSLQAHVPGGSSGHDLVPMLDWRHAGSHARPAPRRKRIGWTPRKLARDRDRVASACAGAADLAGAADALADASMHGDAGRHARPAEARRRSRCAGAFGTPALHWRVRVDDLAGAKLLLEAGRGCQRH